jgi:hypothetical protein
LNDGCGLDALAGAVTMESIEEARMLIGTD